jgi:hypothetical protein
VQIGATGGFTNDSGDPARYADVPEWFKRAVFIETALSLDANPIIPRPTRRDDTDEPDRGVWVNEKGTILLSHARYVPGAWKPNRTS